MQKAKDKVIAAEAEILINARPEKIWSLMTGFADYGSWNPFIVRIDLLDAPGFFSSGTPVAGDRVRLRLVWENGRTGQSAEVVETVRAPMDWKAGNDRAGGSITDPAGLKAIMTYRFDGFLARTGLVRALRIQELSLETGSVTPVVRYRTREEFHGLLAAFVPLAAVRRAFAIHAEALKKAGEEGD